MDPNRYHPRHSLLSSQEDLASLNVILKDIDLYKQENEICSELRRRRGNMQQAVRVLDAHAGSVETYFDVMLDGLESIRDAKGTSKKIVNDVDKLIIQWKGYEEVRISYLL